MQPNLSPFGSVLANPFLFNGDLSEGIETPGVLFLVPFLLFQGGAMDLSKVGEKILRSVRSARSLGLLPSASDRPEVPARAAAAAAVARAIAGLPPHQRFSLSSSSEELSSIYGSKHHGQEVEEIEKEFYEENFDPVRHILEHIPSEESDLAYFERQAALRLAQLDRVAERLSRKVMEHHEVMVKGMHLVRELEKDLKIANVICMNGRRHLTSSRNEVSRDLIVNSNSKKKQALLDMLPVLTELGHALKMQAELESLVEEGNYCKAFQVLSEYLQLLDTFSDLSAVQEMSRGVEVWLGKTLQKLDSLLLGVCQEFNEEGFITVVDAYALIGDISGLAEKLQSFFMQEVLSETHSILKNIVQEEDQGFHMQNSRLTYSDLCLQIPEPKFRQCLLNTLAILFKLMCSYHEIMGFQLDNRDSAGKTPSMTQKESDISPTPGGVQQISPPCSSQKVNGSLAESVDIVPGSAYIDESTTTCSLVEPAGNTTSTNYQNLVDEASKDDSTTSTSGSPWYQLRKDATAFVSQTLQRGRKNLWQLTATRVSVLLSSASVSSASIHQFLKNYEDLGVFILAGEAFCGIEAADFRQKLKAVCENYFLAFHRQNIHALKMVLEREIWFMMPPDAVQEITFPGLAGDGAPIIVPSEGKSNARVLHSDKSTRVVDTGAKKSGFSNWLRNGNPFLLKLAHTSKEGLKWNSTTGESDGNFSERLGDKVSQQNSDSSHSDGANSVSEEDNEDLLADFIDEDSQLPSRISKPRLSRNQSLHYNDGEIIAQTGSSICLLRSMDKYARLMQKLEIVNVEFFKGICQLFEVFFHFVFETFAQQNNNSGGKGSPDPINYRLKTALSRIQQDCDQWIKSPSSSSSSLNSSCTDITPMSPPSNTPGTSFGLKERCAGADTISLVARILHRSKAHLKTMLLQNNAAVVEDFYAHLVDAVPDLVEHIHRTSARQLLHINGYVDRIANAKWEVKELGLEHNGYVDLLLGEFKHYKTRLAHGGIRKEVQDLLLEYGLEIVAQTLIEGLSRVKRCTDEGRALMSLDLQVLINGLQHFVAMNVKPHLQIVEAFIKAYYLPETEYVHWARAHPEYTKNQIVGLINLVATMKSWKRKTRLEVLEKIE
ncbi:syndetin isoform X1 [Pyrus x bretschneideri]|uniref:syndetin isoform X1 n=2 Tax=Pyrus x bretschneideri TaxID=225117 RepID=UPI00202FC4A2|nr:syndetin isoform X1 [Pyrus x bretschneideri]